MAGVNRRRQNVKTRKSPSGPSAAWGWSHLASRDERESTASRGSGALSPLPRRFRFILLPPHLAPGLCDMPTSEKEGKSKERSMASFDSQSSVVSFQPISRDLHPLEPLPLPQRLAPVILLRLSVGFVQALARTRMPSWGWDLVRPGVRGSV